jgi:predicted kinase
MPKLIIFRGNSGSGKSTVAERIASASAKKIVVIDADHYREHMFFPKGKCKPDIAAVMTSNVKYALENGYNVILDSIFHAHERNRKYLASLLVDYHPNDNFIFCFDVSLQETIRRHATRLKYKEFDASYLREWYKPMGSLGYDFEYHIPESNTLQHTMDFIKKTSGI